MFPSIPGIFAAAVAASPSAPQGEGEEEVTVHVLFGGQRLRSRGAACSCDPLWDDDLALDLDTEIPPPGPTPPHLRQVPPGAPVLTRSLFLVSFNVWSLLRIV